MQHAFPVGNGMGTDVSVHLQPSIPQYTPSFTSKHLCMRETIGKRVNMR